LTSKGSRILPILLGLLQTGLAGLALLGLFELGRIQFPLFHSLVEIFFVIVGFSIFIVTWNGRSYLDNPALLLIGITYLFVALADLFDLVFYEGLHLLPGLNLAMAWEAQLAAAYIQAGSLIVAALLTRRRFYPPLVVGLYGVLTILFGVLIFIWGGFTQSVNGRGMGAWITNSAYLIVLMMLVAVILFIRQRNNYHPVVFGYLVLSIVALALAEIASPASMDFIGAQDPPLTAIVGYLFKIIAFFLIYKSVTVTGLVHPYQLLFHNLEHSREELRRERDFVSTILDTTYALIVVLDVDGQILRVNRTFETITGYRQDDLRGQVLWKTGLFGEQVTALRQQLVENLEEGVPLHFEGYLNVTNERRLHIAWDVAVRNTVSGQVEYITFTGIDITDRKQADDELRFLSTHDVLTGLYNRAYFELEMIGLAETDQFPASIVIADVDGLKVINDTYGHLAGDKLLQRAAHILRTAFRTEDVIARMGGDEFAVLLADADESVAEHALRRVRAILTAHNQVNPDFQISLALGSSTAIAGYMLMETYKHADQTMYQDKQLHKSQRHPPIEKKK
jgi:diguanylate cyclase (GGDEF)-like protein/PAS domain S-box-containing protein